MEQFAYALRKLRQEAGGPTYREMARIAHYSVTVLSQAASGTQLPSLAVTLAYVRACKGDAAQWERQWKEAHEAVAAAERGGARSSSPYRGLARFEPDDHDVFFGRDRLVAKAEQLVGQRRFAAILGPSGSGKSSLLRAGLIPVLRDKHRSLSAIRLLTPGEHPLRAHAKALRPAEGDADTVIVIDQFEEVFTLCHDAAERAQFIDHLLGSCDPRSRIRVVVAVRADFYGRCAEHRGLAEALSNSSLLVGPMTSAELREAIVKPAQSAGLIVERALTARLLSEIKDEPGGLPLLSHVLRETWSHRRGRALTLEAYEATGGLHGAIAQTAETVYHQFTATQGPLARLLLLRLITPGEGVPDTRRPVARAELDLAADTGDIDQVLNKLARARLITLDNGMVDLAHEALITGWPRLHHWITESREQLVEHRRLTEAATTWQRLNRDPGTLYRGTRLEAADNLFAAAEHEAALTPLERSFLSAARTARTRARRRRNGLVTILATLLVLALVAGVAAWQQSRNSDRRKIEAEARRAASVADSMRFSDPVKAMQLSVAAWKLAQTSETRSALLSAVVQREEDVFTLPGTSGTQTKHHLTGDGRTLMNISSHRIVTWDVRTHRRTHTYPGIGRPRRGDSVEDSIRVRADGRMIALLQDDSVRLWDVQAGRMTEELKSRGRPWKAEFGPDGRILVVLSNDIEAWDVQEGRLLLRVSRAEEELVQDTAISADGRLLAVCSDERPLQLWDIAKRRKVPLTKGAELASAPCGAGSFALTPDSERVSVVTDTGIRTWHFRSGKELRELDTGRVETLQYSADGRFLAAATRTDEIQLWRAPIRQNEAPQGPAFRYPLISESPYELRLDLAGNAIRYLSATGTTVRSLSLGRAVTGPWQNHQVGAAKWSQDGRTLATVRRTPEDGFQLLAGRTGRGIAQLPGPPCLPTFFAGSCADLMTFSADGRYFAYGRAWGNSAPEAPPRQRITVWDVAKKRRHASLVLPRVKEAGTFAIALSANGRTLAVARDRPRSFELWNVQQGRRVRTVAGFAGPMNSVSELAFRADNTKLVSTENIVTDLRSSRASRHVLGNEETATVAFSKNGKYLAAGDMRGRVTVWDGDLRQRLAVLAGVHTGDSHGPAESVTALAFSPDGGMLAVGGSSGTVQVWDTASNQAVGSPLPTPGDEVLSLAFSADGNTLHASSTHVPLQEYDLAPAHLTEQACERAGGGLPKADWRTYLPELPYRETCA
ncbi:DNA-binding protein [Streptomyces sp. CC224B]|uniref:nSTAND1 domain-containing NTPase n=1 Tax=Streptomyces sp. CC224B TaxID=3044571 RepID=UPI0024A87230|nr:DNA-binding protein [Streptomyces sp. CC224B]